MKVPQAALASVVTAFVTYESLTNWTDDKADVIDDMITGITGDALRDIMSGGVLGSASFIIPAYFRVGNKVADFIGTNGTDPTKRLIASAGVGLFTFVLMRIKESMKSTNKR